MHENFELAPSQFDIDDLTERFFFSFFEETNRIFADRERSRRGASDRLRTGLNIHRAQQRRDSKQK